MIKKVKIGIIQSKISDNFKKNLISAIKSIKKAASKKAKIICMPELFLSSYFCQTESHSNFKLAEKIPGKTTKIFCELAKELQIVLMISLFEKKTHGFYHNTSIVISEKGKILSKYRKMHIPDDPGYYEKFYFTPGDLGFKSVKTKFGKIGPLICWDQWFPEAARLTALKGAQIIFYPTAIGWHPKEKREFGKTQLNSWITMQKSHAIANGTYVVAVNRVGVEKKGNKKIEFWGNSMIIDPSGEIIGELGNKKEEILIREIDYKKKGHYYLIGNSINYEFHKTTIAFNTLKTSFSKPYQPLPSYYNANYSMYKLWNNSINYRFFDGEKTVKGEFAMDQKGSLATTHFFVFKLSDAYNLMANARYFSPKYNSFRANALSESSRVQNEKAVLFAGDYQDEKRQIYMSADFFSFPTPQYLVQLPSYGKEFMGYLNYQITDSLIFKLFFKQESKYKNQKSEFMNEPQKYTLSHAYGKITIKANKGITITSRLDFSKHQTNGLNSFGRTSYLELSHKNELSSFSARMVFFKTDNWDTRIYLYEKDVLYHFSVPALYDEGTRFYINYNRTIGKHIKIWLKYGRTIFENKSSISSGNNEIEGNLKTEIRGQILCKF